MFVYVSPGSSLKKKKRKGGGQGLGFAKIQVAFQFIFNFNWKWNTGKGGGKTHHVFFTESIHWGEEGCCQPDFKTQIFLLACLFFFLAEFLCLHLKKISFHTWQSFLCLSATCHPPSVFPMQLIPRTRRAQSSATQNQELSRSPLVNPFEVSHEVIFNSGGSCGFLEEWGILEERTVSEKKTSKKVQVHFVKLSRNAGREMVARLGSGSCFLVVVRHELVPKITKPSLLAS